MERIARMVYGEGAKARAMANNARFVEKIEALMVVFDIRTEKDVARILRAEIKAGK